MKVLALFRHPRFSPNSVENDRGIMMAVVRRLQQKGHQVVAMQEEARWQDKADCNCIFTMGRLPETLECLRHQRARVVNSSESIDNCSRSRLEATMRLLNIPAAPAKGNSGYWLKRGDACAQEAGDVVYAASETALEESIAVFRRRGITDYTVSAHVEGDLVKFYGVRTTGFFRFFYPTDDGQTKFGDEARNGEARHYAFETEVLHTETERLAEAIGIYVYGGDCIVRPDGTFCIIDFNDWPSFSRCREEAAEAIASLIR